MHVFIHEKHKNEIKKTILITIASQRIKILRTKFNQGGISLIHWKLKNIVEIKKI